MLAKTDYPPRLNLARTGTPLQKLERLSGQLGVEIFCKRDDLTGSELSGNKVRKLEFLLADAREKGADTVITCGGAQSNHCRATALAAVQAGLRSVLLLRTDDPANPPPAEGNILLNRMAGAELVWVSPSEYKERHLKFEEEAARLRQAGRKPYIVPEGGSNHIGAWGYVLGMQEIVSDLQELGINDLQDASVITATGSGGTMAGLLLGAGLLGSEISVTGINVCDDEEYFVREIHHICRNFCTYYEANVTIQPSDISIVDGYVGRGYGLSTREELQAICDFARLEGIILDPVYTGKAFSGMVSEIKKNPDAFGKRVVFLHTGGLFGLFPIADQLAELLDTMF